jgi:3-deoxy-D-manno-octulosonic-acid transferase
VGEVNTAKPLLSALHSRWPELPQVLTVSTASGYAYSQGLTAPWLHITHLPFDTVRVVRDFLRRLNPRMLILVETELWPSIIAETRRLDVPVVLISGRLSAKHFGRYRCATRLVRPLLAEMAALGVQTPLYAERFERLGADPARIHITGSTKYDGVATEVPGIDELRQQLNLEPADPVLVFGSTRPGDESLAYACWTGLRSEFPRLRLIVAPRHLQRLGEVAQSMGEPVCLWSEVVAGATPEQSSPLVVDTMGELVRFYALATVAVVGGSFFPGVEGHNPFEPAALAVPTVFGPYMSNFAEPAAMLLDGHGAIQVSDSTHLADAIAGLLRAPGQRKALGIAARGVVAANRGAIARTLEIISSHLQV